MNKLRIIWWGLVSIALLALIFGILYNSYIFLNCFICCFVLLIIGVAFLDMQVLLPMEQAVEDLLYGEKNPDSKEDFFIKGGNNFFLKQINLAAYVYKTSRNNPKSAEIFQKQTELLALQSQINPHFLYNTLDTIRGQALIDQNLQVADMIENLGSFFRYSISGKENMVMLRDEINHTINYINIQKFRFSNRFVFDVEVDDEEEDCMNCLVPRLILQPIVENAIFHGLEDTNEGGRIGLDITRVTGEIIITVSDNGIGMSADKLNRLNERIHSSKRTLTSHDSGKDHTGIALPNINRRIKLLFGDAYGLAVFSTLGRGTDVEIILPVINETKEK